MQERFSYHPVREGDQVVAFEVRKSARIGGEVCNGFHVVQRIACNGDQESRDRARRAAVLATRRITKACRKADRIALQQAIQHGAF